MVIRASLDPSTVARGLLQPTGPARELIDAWIANRFEQVTCVGLVDELRHILNHPPIAARLELTREQVDQLLGALLAESEVVAGHVALSVLDSFPREDCLLSCAVEGTVDYVVTTGRDLLSLGEYGGFPIVTPQSFLATLTPSD